jgi:prepilin peptidase CpaA
MIALLTLSVFPAALLIAAANDLYEFKIPNWVSITLVFAYFAAGLAVAAPAGLMLEGFLVGAAALVVGFALYAFRIVGGGDAKLLAASAPWIGLTALPGFVVKVAFAGAALAILLIVFRRLPPLPVYAQAPWILRLHQRPKDIPYGVAIAAGGLLAFPQAPFFKLVFGG